MAAEIYWEARAGADIGITTSTASANVKASDSDSIAAACNEWQLGSMLTNYAEYCAEDLKAFNTALQTTANGGLVLGVGVWVYVTFPRIHIYLMAGVDLPGSAGCSAELRTTLFDSMISETWKGKGNDLLRDKMTHAERAVDENFQHALINNTGGSNPYLFRQTYTFAKGIALKGKSGRYYLWPDGISDTSPTTIVAYSSGTTVQSSPSATATATVAPGWYSVQVELLRNDLSGTNEKATGIRVKAGSTVIKSFGECNPDGGDYDCTFFTCLANEQVIELASSATLTFEIDLVGHSHDCDCDTSTWECAKESTKSGFTAMTAVAKFILSPTAPPTTIVAYSSGTTVQSSPSATATATVAPGWYSVQVELLRNDLSGTNEKATGIRVKAGSTVIKSFGECNPDGGDYDCTFFTCLANEQVIELASSATLTFEIDLVGHSHDCDCDTSTWECAKESTKSGFTAMTAVAKFTILPR